MNLYNTNSRTSKKNLGIIREMSVHLIWHTFEWNIPIFKEVLKMEINPGASSAISPKNENTNIKLLNNINGERHSPISYDATRPRPIPISTTLTKRIHQLFEVRLEHRPSRNRTSPPAVDRRVDVLVVTHPIWIWTGS